MLNHHHNPATAVVLLKENPSSLVTFLVGHKTHYMEHKTSMAPTSSYFPLSCIASIFVHKCKYARQPLQYRRQLQYLTGVKRTQILQWDPMDGTNVTLALDFWPHQIDAFLLQLIIGNHQAASSIFRLLVAENWRWWVGREKDLFLEAAANASGNQQPGSWWLGEHRSIKMGKWNRYVQAVMKPHP